MRILYFDCFSGASGDMILGALIDAGVPLGEIRNALGSLAIAADTVWTERVTRAGLSALKFCVRGEDLEPETANDHEGHDHQPQSGDRHAVAGRQYQSHRSLREIARLIETSALSAAGKSRAKALFATLGEAEAAVHGVTLDEVHLHEVGALDSIVDVVGTVFALEYLHADRIVSSPLNVGGGSIRSAHGVYPVPAPATMRLLNGAPIYAGPQKSEMVTPTGALLIAGYATEFGGIPPMRVRHVGYGAGARDFVNMPNVLRVLVGEESGPAPVQPVVVIEAEIDDMNPQIFGTLMETLLAQGALDVFYTAIQMKKNRPGTLVSIVAAPDARERLTATLFRETTTIGVRYREMSRECLDREVIVVPTPLGAIRFKIATRNGELLNASPEFDDCVKAAGEHGRPVKEVQAIAVNAFYETRS